MSITVIILGITVAISIYAFSNQEMLYKWMMNPYAVARKNEVFRFVTSGFIHSDYVHLGFNMFTFYFFGRAIEPILEFKAAGFGELFFVLFYLLAIIVSEIPTFVKHKNNPNYNSLGASGGVAAVLFFYIMFMPVEKIYLYGLPVPGFVLGIAYMVYSYIMSKKSKDNVNHDAHFYGAMFGVLAAILIEPLVVGKFFREILGYVEQLF